MAVDGSSSVIHKEVCLQSSPVAGTETLDEPVLMIKLLVDKEKNKVVLAEVDKDFVDVLYSFLALPMGTIVRLLEKYQQNQKSQATPIGCFNNLYGSVRNMDTDDFMTEACKHALLNTRGVKESQCRELHINIDDNEELKYYRCSDRRSETCYRAYSNFCTSICSCGSLMNEEFDTYAGRIDYELFASKNESFIVTDDMEVGPASISLMLKTIKGLGYADAGKLQEALVYVNHEKVLALLECLFSSDTPLTDVFLKNRSSYVVTRTLNMISSTMQDTDKKISKKEFLLTVFVRKQDGKVLYAESKEDFVDLLFSFLAVPLEYVWELCGSSITLGCIGNFCKSIKRYDEAPYRTTYRCILHWHYSVPQPLLGVCYKENIRVTTLSKYYSSYRMLPMHPNGNTVSANRCSGGGFVKGGQTYMIADDLTVVPVNPYSRFTMLKMLETDLDDINEHVIKISEAEAFRLLMASLMTSNALTTALACLIPKKLKNEKPCLLNPKEAKKRAPAAINSALGSLVTKKRNCSS